MLAGLCIIMFSAAIHVEFATEPGRNFLYGSEGNASVEICLRLANVGSYNPEARLTEDVAVQLTSSGELANY